MAIDLLNSFLQRGQNVSSNQKSVSSKAPQTTQNLPQNLQVMRAIRALQAGQTLQGEIVSVKGDEVQLVIMNDVLIDAKLAQSMNLTPGTTMPFQVKANTSQGLSLIPLFTNTAADPNALKALDMAQIPVNDRSLEMVQTLMEKGMPIDKQSIQEMYREVVAFKDAVVRDIVSLHQMKMSVTQENLNQLSLYQNNQHYLKDTFSNIGSAIGEQLGNLVAEGKTDSAKSLIQQLQQLFQSGEESAQISSENKAATDSNLMANSNQNTQGVLENGGQGKTTTIVLTEEMLLSGEKNILPEEMQQVTQKGTEAGKQTVENLNSKVVAEAQNLGESEARKTTDLQTADSNQQVNWKDLADALTKEKAPGKIG